MNLARYRKFGVALAGACLSFATTVLMSDPGPVQPEEWVVLLIGVGGAIGVRQVANED
jgi:hypothetical protein